jgi:DNA-binding response OmpR family regulator
MVERDPFLRAEVARRLGTEQIAFREDDGRADLGDLALAATPDVIVLELSGYQAGERLASVRAVSDAPVIALLDRVVDCVDALEQGADDYLEKPLAPRELVAKIRSVVRRLEAERVTSPVVLGGLVVDLERGRVTVDDRVVPMPGKECALLACLARRPLRVFSRHELLEEVWSASESWLGPATVTEHVRRLRRRLTSARARVAIETVRGRGYRIRGTG